MITKFNNYIVESRKSIDYLETLTPDKLGKLLLAAVDTNSPSMEYIQNLLDVGSPINFRDGWGRTPLIKAASNGHLELVDVLIQHGIELDARDNSGWTSLHWAASNGWLEVVQLLVSKGADIQAKTNKGDTAWDMATSSIKRTVPELNPNK